MNEYLSCELMCEGHSLEVDLCVHGFMTDILRWCPVWVPRLGFCPLTGHNPGLLLAFLLDITI
jgi:hypothetical protein